jgi:hypothetical protein
MKYLLVCMFAVCAPLVTRAEALQDKMGFVDRAIWYTYTASDTEPTVSVHSVVQNTSADTFTGVVSFFDGKTLLGETPVSVPKYATLLVTKTIPDTKTVHSFYATLTNGESSAGVAVTGIVSTQRLYVRTRGAVGLTGAVSLPPQSLKSSTVSGLVAGPKRLLEWARFKVADWATWHAQDYWQRSELSGWQRFVRGFLQTIAYIASFQALFYSVGVLILVFLVRTIRRIFFGL